MLSFFPTPYPHELWYSVIARYHKHCGTLSWQATVEHLFNGSKSANVGSFFPNETIHQVLAQLPSGFFDPKDIAINHTLLPFLMRFQPTGKKEAHLQEFLDGKDMQPRYLRATRKIKPRSLRYCPLCCQGDIQTYEEAYWHREHQIGLMPLCPHHHCRLQDEIIPNTRPLGAQYLPLDGKENEQPDYSALDYEQELTDTLYTYLIMPFEIGPNIKADNLARAIENAGLLCEDSIRKQAFDTERLYAALTEKYGKEITAHYFGDHITKAHALRQRHFLIYSAEEYALLTVLVDQKPDVIFSNEQIPLELEEHMKELAESHILYKAGAAKLLGIKTDRLLPYAKRFGIEPFWPQSGVRKEKSNTKTYAVTLNLSPNELAELDTFIEEKGMGAYSHALRFFFETGLDKWKRENEF